MLKQSIAKTISAVVNGSFDIGTAPKFINLASSLAGAVIVQNLTENAEVESLRQIFSSTGTSSGLTPESDKPLTNHSRIWPMPRL